MTYSRQTAFVGAVIGCTLAAFGMWSTAFELVVAWNKSEAYHYAWLVLPMFVYILGWNWMDEIQACHPIPSAYGIFFAVVAAMCWSMAALANIDVLRQFALVLVVQCVALSALGLHVYWRLFPVFGLLFLMLPSGDLLLSPLRLLTVKSIELFATIAHLPYQIDGFSILIAGHSYFVLDACAGLPHVTLTFFLAYCIGLLAFRTIGKVASIALIGAALGAFSNVLRVNAIIWIDWAQGSQMSLAAHGKIQWIVLMVILALLLRGSTYLRDDTVKTQPVIGRGEQLSLLGVYAPILAGLMVLMISGMVTVFLSDEASSPQKESVNVLPRKISTWDLASPSVGWVVDSLNGFKSITSTYKRNGQDLRVTVIETLVPGSKLQESRLAPDEKKTWRDARTEVLESCSVARCLKFKHVQWTSDQLPQIVRHVYTSYYLGSFHTDSNFQLRLINAWYRVIRPMNAPRLVGLSIDGAALPLDELVVIQQSIEAALTGK